MRNPLQSLFLRSEQERHQLWAFLVKTVEHYFKQISDHPVKAGVDVEEIKKTVQSFRFETPREAHEILTFVVEKMWQYQTHFTHPCYFGLFDSASHPIGVIADALTATFNAQLATTFQSAFPIAVEQHLLQKFGEKFGYKTEEIEGVFTSGGMEANHTALLTALIHHFPEFRQKGIRALPQQPVLYVSQEAHFSYLKSARICGLGDDSVRLIPVDERLQMDCDNLRGAIQRDRERGFAPFFIGSTAGTTKAGIVDPLNRVSDIAQAENLWHHVDGAWGGAAIISPTYCSLLKGIERSDSILLDAHKWLSVSIGAGLYLTRHRGILESTFGLDPGYLPYQNKKGDLQEPFRCSIQGSRRFIGLKLFLLLSMIGWEGYAQLIDRHVELGERLRERLTNSEWKIVNRTQLPVVCFTDGQRSREQNSLEYLNALIKQVISSGRAWLSVTQLSGLNNISWPVLRAEIINYRTSEADLDTLIQALNQARKVLS